MEIKTFGVIGAGQMGNGIAQVAAASGLNIIMNDIAEEFVEKGIATITKNLDRSVDKGKMSKEEKETLLGRIKGSVDLKDMVSSDFIVEAATEREDLKFQIFRDLDGICRPEVILSTNTSSIPIGRIASQTKRPEKVIGMHFMNPVPVMKLVEVIRGLATSDETFCEPAGGTGLISKGTCCGAGLASSWRGSWSVCGAAGVGCSCWASGASGRCRVSSEMSASCATASRAGCSGASGWSVGRDRPCRKAATFL